MFIKIISNEGGIKISQYEFGHYMGCQCRKRDCGCDEKPRVIHTYYRRYDTSGRRAHTTYGPTSEGPWSKSIFDFIK